MTIKMSGYLVINPYHHWSHDSLKALKALKEKPWAHLSTGPFKPETL